jgi:hypothetical protein
VKMLAYDRFKPGVARAQAAAAVSPPDPTEVAYEAQRSSPRLAFRSTATTLTIAEPARGSR